MTNNKIAIIGVGNLGGAIINGLVASKSISKKNLFLCDLNPALLEPLKKQGIFVTNTVKAIVKQADIIIVSVKPQHVKTVLPELAPLLNNQQLIISTAAGVTIKDIRLHVVTNPVFRVMPNTAMSVRESMTCIASDKASAKQRKEVLTIFEQLGKAIEIPEDLMGPATILGASGIAFALRYIRAAMQAGIEMGFEHDHALEIVTQTVKGATQLLQHNGNHPEEEIDRVSTPGGVTITGLNEMENKGFTGALIQGIVKANNKIIKK